MSATTTVAAPLHLVAERDPRRDRRHLPLVSLGWTAGALLWWRVLGETSGHQVTVAVAVILLSLAASLSVNLLWVDHNLRLHRTRGPRTGLPTAALSYEQDWVGRSVTAHWDSVRGAQEVLVAAGDDWKIVWGAREVVGR